MKPHAEHAELFAADTELLFSAEQEAAPSQQRFWTVLIVDDEPEIHQVTRMALSDFRYQDAGLQFISAYSAKEAKNILAAQHDIALILLDVVMETDDAGLTLVHYIRDTLRNHLVRIVLRTGQPGQAPEQRIMHDYDINDYRAKTELTVQRLATTVLAALRAFTAMQQLALMNETLEAQVQARTAQLAASNLQLQQSLAELQAGQRAGKQLQFAMLPPAQFTYADYQLSHVLYPSDYMSGDFVDYFLADEHHIVFYIADVSGHGVASAFITVYLKRFISTYLERYQRGSSRLLLEPAALLLALNTELLQDKLNKHIALFYAVLDTRSATLAYANAGAFPWPIMVQQNQAHYLELKSTPVGMFDFASYQDQSLTLPPDSALLLCSDGILDLLTPADTEQKLQLLLAQCSAEQDLARLLQRLAIEPALGLPDDLTLLVLKRGSAS